MKPLRTTILLSLILTSFAIMAQDENFEEQKYFSYKGTIGKYPVEFTVKNSSLESGEYYDVLYMYTRVGTVIELNCEKADMKDNVGYVKFSEKNIDKITGYLTFPNFKIGGDVLNGTFKNPANGAELPITLKKVPRRANGSYDFLKQSSNTHYIRFRIRKPERPLIIVFEKKTNKYVTAIDYCWEFDSYSVNFYDVNFDGIDDITYAAGSAMGGYSYDNRTYVSTPNNGFECLLDGYDFYLPLSNNILECHGEVNGETTLIRWKSPTEYEYLIKERDWQPFPKLNHHMSPMYVFGAYKSIMYAEPTEASDAIAYYSGGYESLILIDKKSDKKNQQQWYYCYDIHKGLLGWVQKVNLFDDEEYMKIYTRTVIGFAPTPKQVEMNLGKPEDSSGYEERVHSHYYKQIREFTYDGFSLTYSEDKLIRAEVNKPGIAFDDLYCNKKGCDKDYVIKKYAVTKAELKENKDPSKLEFIRYKGHKYTFEFTKKNLIKSIQFEWIEDEEDDDDD